MTGRCSTRMLRAQFGTAADAIADLEIKARQRGARIDGDEAAAKADIAFRPGPNGRGVRVALALDPALVPTARRAAVAAAEELSRGLGPRCWEAALIRHPE